MMAFNACRACTILGELEEGPNMVSTWSEKLEGKLRNFLGEVSEVGLHFRNIWDQF